MVGRARLIPLVLVAALGGLAVVRWLTSPTAEADAAVGALPFARSEAKSDEPLAPLEAPVGLDPRKVALGHALFDDPRLSHGQATSCATCHALDDAGVDRRRHQLGGALAVVDTPTVWNSSLNFRQFWDGRARTLEDQIDGPMLNPAEMASLDWKEVVARVAALPEYHAAFHALYPAGLDAAAIKDAIATFESSLVTLDSRFDRYLRGDQGAITAEEKSGYELFKSYGCASCHQGRNVGGNMFAKLGAIENYFAARSVNPRDLGRFNTTGDARDRFRFRVPSLRLVALTAPYFHDGSVSTLEEAVRIMGRYQLGHAISDGDDRRIVAFLKTLPGRMQVAQ